MRSHRKGWRVRGFAGCLTLGLLTPGIAFAADSADEPASANASVTNSATSTPSTTATKSAPITIKDPLASPYPAEADGQGPRVGPHYRLLRGAEDWRFMGTANAPDDRFAPLKAIPLDGDGNVTLSLSGDQRTSAPASAFPPAPC